jgi:hypothetical protein
MEQIGESRTSCLLSCRGRRRLILDSEPKVLDHPVIRLGRLAAGGQVVTDEDRVGGVEAEWLEGAEPEFSTAGNAQIATGVDKAEQGERSQAVAWGEVPCTFQGRAGDGIEEVDRNRFNRQVPQGEGHFDQVVGRFAHADNPARADFKSGIADCVERCQAIGKVVRGADLSVVIAACIEVMIDTVDSARLETLRLIVAEQTNGDADLQRVGLFDFRDDLAEGVDFPRGGPAARKDDAVGARLTLLGLLGTGQKLLTVEEIVRRDSGVGDPRLGAVAAVFGTKAGLGADEKVEFDSDAEVVPPDPEDGGQQLQELIVGAAEHVEGLLSREWPLLKHLVG